MRPSSVAFTHLLGCAANDQLGGFKIRPLVLPSKPKTLSLRQTLNVAVCTCNPDPGRTDSRILGAHWPARLLELESSKFNERLCLRKVSQMRLRKTPTLTSGLHTCASTHACSPPHMCAHKHRHTQMTRYLLLL